MMDRGGEICNSKVALQQALVETASSDDYQYTPRRNAGYRRFDEPCLAPLGDRVPALDAEALRVPAAFDAPALAGAVGALAAARPSAST